MEEDSDEDRPLSREEIKQKTLRGLNKREKTATDGKTQKPKRKGKKE
jgi:hypothetical protein